MTELDKQLTQFPFQLTINVRWGEMDAAQHVNNVAYVRYAETARIAFMDQLPEMGWSGTQGDGIILAWQDCKYIFPVTYPDTLQIGVKVSEIREDRFFLQCHMFSEKHGRLAAITNHSHVPYSYVSLSKIPMSDFWRSELEKWC